MKKIVTMQDISCVGKCSLTVALPVLSAMGIETAVIPTAVLSTHTMFKGFTFHDLTSEVNPILTHWKKKALHSMESTQDILVPSNKLILQKRYLRIWNPCPSYRRSMYGR